MNKYCYKCQSVYSAILGRCPKCRDGVPHNGRSSVSIMGEKRIYYESISTKSMDTLKRIENAEEELRLAKLELLNDDSQTRKNIDEVTDMLRDMSLLPHAYNIIQSKPHYVKVEVDSGYNFIDKYVRSGWSVGCHAYHDKLIIIFRVK